MRTYVRQGNGVWSAFAPEVPGIGFSGHENWATREEALESCRSLVAGEIAAYARLGVPLELTEGDEIVDWMAPFWLIPEVLIPIRPAQMQAALRRMDELAAELERVLDALPADRWNRNAGTEWSARITLDHLASGMGVGIQNLESLPLDPIAAQAASVGDLSARLREHVGRHFGVEQFGTNDEARRIRWTPRKVARVVGELQQAWTAHIAGDGPSPGAFGRHDDRDGDDVPLTAAEIEPLTAADRTLQADSRPRQLAFSYRYYRHRLDRWPDDERERWRAMHRAFLDRLRSFDDTELARVRVLPIGPLGPVSTVRGELRIGIAHVLGHIAQIRAAGAEG
jgi:hypothetical protein